MEDVQTKFKRGVVYIAKESGEDAILAISKYESVKLMAEIFRVSAMFIAAEIYTAKELNKD